MSRIGECAVDGCDKRARCRSWCSAHYNRWRKYGDPLASKPDPLRVRSVAGMICAVDDCGKPVKSASYCASHYQRFRKHGDPLAGRTPPSPKGSPCDVEGCTRPRLARGYCKPHYRRFMQHGDPLGSGAPAHRVLPEDIDRDGKRTCTRCGLTKPLDQFGLSSRGRSGRKRWCTACYSANSSAWQKANPQRVQTARRAALVRRMYGEAGVLAEQRRLAGEGCDVCGRRPPGKRGMAIDHCHVTGQFRGLLCAPCNQALGLADEDPARLRALADYLERPPQV